MEQVVNGEKNVMSSREIVALFRTSGTTGTSKIYPVTREYLDEDDAVIAEIFPTTILNLLNLQRYAQFHIFSAVKKSKTGIPIGPVVEFIFRFPPCNLIPKAYSQLHDEDASCYAQALFSLAEKELRYIVGFSSDFMYSYMKFITQHWDQFCEDISSGKMGMNVKMPDNVREDLSKQLRADPQRAEELRIAMKDGIVGLARRIWPDIAFILLGKAAGFKMAANFLMENHFKGIKIIDYTLDSSEGMTGVNLEGPNSHQGSIFTLSFVPWFFIEFIPLDRVDEENPKTVFADQV